MGRLDCAGAYCKTMEAALHVLLEENLAIVEVRSTARSVVEASVCAAVEAVESSSLPTHRLAAQSSSSSSQLRHLATLPSVCEVIETGAEGEESPRPRQALLGAGDESPRPREVLVMAPSPPLKPLEPPIMMDFKVSLPAKWAPPPTPWRPGGRATPSVTSTSGSSSSRKGKAGKKTLHLGGGAAGLTENVLLNLGYRKHMGKYCGSPYDAWSCCGTADRECTLRDPALQDISYVITDPRDNFGDPDRFVPPPSPPQMLSMSLGSTQARAVPPVCEPARLSGALSREEILSPGRRVSPSRASVSAPMPPSSPLRRSSLSLVDTPTPSKIGGYSDVQEAVARAEEATRAAISTARNVRRSISAQSRPGTVSGAQRREHIGPASLPANVQEALLQVRQVGVPASNQPFAPILPPSEHDDMARDIAASMASSRQRLEMEERVAEMVGKALQGEREAAAKAVQTAVKAEASVKAMEASSRAACDDAQKHAKGQRAVLEQMQAELVEQGNKLRGLAVVVGELKAKQTARERSEARDQRRQLLNTPRALPAPAAPRAALSHSSPPRGSRPLSSRPSPPPSGPRLHTSAELPLRSTRSPALRASVPAVAMFRHCSSSSGAASVASAETGRTSISRRSVSAPSRIGPPPSSLLPSITFAQPTASFPLHYSPPSSLKPLPKRLQRQLNAAKQRKIAAGPNGPEQLRRSLSGIPEDVFAEAEAEERKETGVLDGLNVSDITADEFDGLPTPASAGAETPVRAVLTRASPATPLSVSTPAPAPAPATPATPATHHIKADSPTERPLDRALWWQGVMRRRAEALQAGASRV